MADPASAWLVPDWPAPANVRAVATTRDGPAAAQSSPFGFNLGMRCGDDAAFVARNRAVLGEVLALPSEPCWLHQVHGTRTIAVTCPHPSPPPRAREEESTAQVNPFLPPRAGEGARRVDGGDASAEPEADAAVTRASGVVLAIQTADCLPVLFCADNGSEVAAAHAGWRGIAAGVLEATLAAMQAPRARVLAWLGPAIAAQSYEVGDEVRDVFVAHDAAAASAFTTMRPGHWLCDLYELARQRLHAAGVMRVFGGGFDTYTDPRLHSYRRDGACSGRMASLVWMAPTGD